MIEKIYSSEVDVAVLLLFFTRTDITAKTFEQIRKARPSKLFLYQDGPREGRPDDIDNINKCRHMVESSIDWECDIYRMYQEKNFGCDPSEYLSQKWMFSYVDKGIIIEDDDVMSVSFFKFCKELLDKYEYDTRINIICGMNQLGEYVECPSDYFFVRKGGSIWGWATWKRVIDEWDSAYEFMNSNYSVNNLSEEYGYEYINNFIKTCKRHLSSGREHYESILGASCYLNGRMNIVPKYNMTSNIGIGIENTHSVSNLSLLPRAIRKIFYMKTYEYNFPLRHPKYIQPDYKYWKMVEKQIYGNWVVRIFQLRRIESLIYRIIARIFKYSSN